MAEYKGIKGFKVQYLSADPSTSILGDIWYNSTSKALKFTGYQAGSWATGGNMNNTRRQLGGSGLQTAGLAIAGITTAFPGVNNVEEYDGATWANATVVNTTRFDASGAGTQTATVAFGGFTTSPTTASEEYDGSTWTSGNPIVSAPFNSVAATGTQTAALGAGASHQHYDGTSWSSQTALPSPGGAVRGSGTQTSSVVYGSSGCVVSQEWTGAAWTAGGTMNTERQLGGGTGNGTINSALASAGETPATSTISAATESYDGTSWSTETNCSTARKYGNGCGTYAAALLFAGEDPATGNTNATEEWTGAGAATKTITVS